MTKQKSYTDITVDRINETADKHGWRSDVTTNYIQAQIATNIALLVDCLIEIYGAERRKEIDDERNKMCGD